MTDAQQEAISPSDVGVTEVKPHKKTQPIDTYKVLCCGNSALDLLLIPLCLIGVYTLTGVLFALCATFVLRIKESSAALWTFFVVYVAFIMMLGIVLAATAYEKKNLKKHENDGITE